MYICIYIYISDGQIPIAIRFKSRFNRYIRFDLLIKDSICYSDDLI